MSFCANLQFNCISFHEITFSKTSEAVSPKENPPFSDWSLLQHFLAPTHSESLSVVVSEWGYLGLSPIPCFSGILFPWCLLELPVSPQQLSCFPYFLKPLSHFPSVFFLFLWIYLLLQEFRVTVFACFRDLWPWPRTPNIFLSFHSVKHPSQVVWHTYAVHSVPFRKN